MAQKQLVARIQEARSHTAPAKGAGRRGKTPCALSGRSVDEIDVGGRRSMKHLRDSKNKTVMGFCTHYRAQGKMTGPGKFEKQTDSGSLVCMISTFI